NKDFDEVKALFDKVITEHCKDKTSIAVLGAGACGLLHGLADRFQFSYALDLSLPTLSAAKRLIEGERLVFHLEQADWQRIELLPPPPLTNPIRYLAADVMNMPFKNASMSVVVTQYMLDFASDPGRLTEEIYRILKPGGIWINFSNPFRVLDDPIELGRRKLNELPAYFETFGFDTVSLENKRFTLLNMEKIVAEVGNNKNLVHFFTLKKSETIPDNKRRPIRRFFLENEAVWLEIPKLVKGRELTIAHKKKLDGQQANNGWIEFTVLRHSFIIPSNLALLLETFIEHVDGKTTLRSLFTLLQRKGMALSEKAFMHLVYILHIQHNLISLDG
ncbi:MAG: class I SAM-dependent methyltransferase, partial [Gammaproteobacteria bacterium]